MAAPSVSMHQLLDVGAHFGHQTHRWNPKMKPYIFGDRNGVHIIDLSQTVPLMARALDFVNDHRPVVAARSCSSAPSARRRSRSPRPRASRASTMSTTAGWAACSPTGRRSRARSSASRRSRSSSRAIPQGLTKKEVLQLTRERDKFELSLGGIRDMGGIPDVMFVIDANKEELAIKEANTLGIPVVAILDSNVSPDGIAFPIPANDDASRAIRLYCDLVAEAATKGNQRARAGIGYRFRRDRTSRRRKPRSRNINTVIPRRREHSSADRRGPA